MHSEYEKFCAEFDQTVIEYEQASRNMLHIARNPDASADEFRMASAYVSELGDRLKELRSMITVLLNARNTEELPCFPLDAPPIPEEQLS